MDWLFRVTGMTVFIVLVVIGFIAVVGMHSPGYRDLVQSVRTNQAGRQYTAPARGNDDNVPSNWHVVR